MAISAKVKIPVKKSNMPVSEPEASLSHQEDIWHSTQNPGLEIMIVLFTVFKLRGENVTINRYQQVKYLKN